MSNFRDVQNLYKDKFGISMRTLPHLTTEDMIGRANFIEEELIELKEAIHNSNSCEVIDALIDIVYVAMGTAVMIGVNWEPHWNLVQEANMLKESGSNEKRKGLILDLTKPKGWLPPNHNLIEYQKPKLMIIGHARHGKDTVCELLRDRYGYNYKSSSIIIAPIIRKALYPIEYLNDEACWKDRINHREGWFNFIKIYTQYDKTKLAKLIYSKANIYCGVRDASELWAINKANLYYKSIWVDASDRLPLEDKSSMNLTHHMADVTLNNNGSLEDLETNLANVMRDL